MACNSYTIILINFFLDMPDYCSVPECYNLGTGHQFPSDPVRKMKWMVAIKRIDPATGKLWQPKPSAVVCRNHFSPEDYTSTLLGMQSLNNLPTPRH